MLQGGWSLTQVNEMTKIVIIIILKPDLRVDLGQHKIKVVIITILKLNSRGSTQGKTRVTDQEGQFNNKNCYYHSFKTWLRSRPGQGLGHRPRGSI